MIEAYADTPGNAVIDSSKTIKIQFLLLDLLGFDVQFMLCRYAP